MFRPHTARWIRSSAIVAAAIGLSASTFTAIAASAASAGSGAIAQGVAVPAYINPTSDPGAWATLSAPSSSGDIVVANVLNGPGTAPDPAWTQALATAHAAGDKVLGYVDTGYLASVVNGWPNGLPTRSNQFGLNAWIPQIEQDVAAWYGEYGSSIDGIFFDDGTNTCGPTDTSNLYASTYAALTGFVKSGHLGAMTVVNPGTAVPQCYENSADVLLTFEGSFGDYTGATATPYIPLSWDPVDPHKIWHVIYGAPDLTALSTVVALSKTRGAGWIDVTNDVPANPYDALPPADYWAAEHAQAIDPGVVSGDAPSVPDVSLGHQRSAATKVTLDWDPSVSGTAPIVAYDVYENGTLVQSVPGDTTAVTVANLTPSTTYTFAVAARDSTGVRSAVSPALPVTTDDANSTLPTAPGGLAVVATGYSTATLTWSPSTGASRIANYLLYEGDTEIAVLPRTMTTVTVGVALPGLSTYTFSVRAVDTSGSTSPASNAVAATTVPIPENQDVANTSVVTNADGSITYSADFPQPFAFHRAFIETSDASLPCLAAVGPASLCVNYLIENGQLLKYAGDGTDFTFSLVAAVAPVISGADTYTWTFPASDIGSPDGQVAVFNGEGYTPITWADPISVGAAPVLTSVPYSVADRPALVESVLAALATVTLPTPPAPVAVTAPECPAVADDVWHVSRLEGCLVGTIPVSSNLVDGLLVGSFAVDLTDVVTLAPSDRTWTEQVTLEMDAVTGDVPPYSVTLSPSCAATCVASPPATVDLAPGAPVTLTFTGSDNGPTTDLFNTAWQGSLTPEIPPLNLPFTTTAPTSAIQWSTPDLRCDSVAAPTPGCVFPETIPTFALSGSDPTLSDVTQAILEAQSNHIVGAANGLKGVGAPLAFTSDPQRIAANVAASCDGSRWTHQRQLCSSFPFPTTYQGAALNDNATLLLVSRFENARTTALFGTWSDANRLLDGDEFWVTVTP